MTQWAVERWITVMAVTVECRVSVVVSTHTDTDTETWCRVWREWNLVICLLSFLRIDEPTLWYDSCTSVTTADWVLMCRRVMCVLNWWEHICTYSDVIIIIIIIIVTAAAAAHSWWCHLLTLIFRVVISGVISISPTLSVSQCYNR